MNPPKHFVSAAAIVLNDKNEILLIKGPQRGWEMPGGVGRRRVDSSGCDPRNKRRIWSRH